MFVGGLGVTLSSHQHVIVVVQGHAPFCRWESMTQPCVTPSWSFTSIEGEKKQVVTPRVWEEMLAVYTSHQTTLGNGLGVWTWGENGGWTFPKKEIARENVGHGGNKYTQAQFKATEYVQCWHSLIVSEERMHHGHLCLKISCGLKELFKNYFCSAFAESSSLRHSRGVWSAPQCRYNLSK